MGVFPYRRGFQVYCTALPLTGVQQLADPEN